MTKITGLMRRIPLLHLNLFKILVLTLLAGGCKNDNETLEVPPYVLQRDSFVQIMADFAIAESAANMNIGNQPVFRLDTAYAFNPVFEYGISRARLDSTMAFYARHPEQYERVYQSVLDTLNSMKKVE